MRVDARHSPVWPCGSVGVSDETSELQETYGVTDGSARDNPPCFDIEEYVAVTGPNRGYPDHSHGHPYA